MSLTKRVSAVLLLILAIVMQTHAQEAKGPQFKVPDFAYPQTVEKDARALLEKADAMSADTGPTRLRALVELCQAQVLIDNDAAYKQPAIIAAQLDKGALSNASKAMLLALEATVYSNIYNGDRWKYNAVDAPLEPYPTDVSEWSGLQFRTRICSLLKEAQALADATPLSDYEGAVEYSPQALYSLPSVADFVRYRRYETANAFQRFEYGESPADICREALTTAKEATAPYFYWNVKLASNSSDAYSILWELYSRFDTVESARLVLNSLCDLTDDGYRPYYMGEFDNKKETARKDELIKVLKVSLEKFPTWYDNARLSNTLRFLTRANATLTVPSMAAPGHEFSVKVKYNFAKEVAAGIYRLPAGGDDMSAEKILRRMPRIAYQTVTTDKTRGETTLKFTVAEPGNYAVLVGVDGKMLTDNSSDLLVTPILGFTAGCRNAAAAAVDFITGAPVKNVAVSLNTRKNRSTTTTYIGKTDSKGLVNFDSPANNGSYYSKWLSYNYKGHSYDFSHNIYVNTFNVVNDSTAQYECLVLTDRNIYHPGDSISWALVAGSKVPREKDGKTYAGKTFEVTLIDANGQKADSATVVTDAYGRAYGSFGTRKGILTGSYHIEAAGLDENEHVYGDCSVTVSDFKTPTIYTEVTDVCRDLPKKGSVTLKGEAMTYSGMPVASAKVDLSLRGATRWRWFTPQLPLGKLSATTDAAGKFTIEIPAEMLARPLFNNRPYTDFIAEITVTSATAETAETSRTFTTGKPYNICAEIPALANADKPLSVKVDAFDANCTKQPIAYTWRLFEEGSTANILSGSAKTGTPLDIDISKLAAGDYSFEATPADTTLANPSQIVSTTIYSILRNAIPANINGFMLPESVIDAEGNSARIMVGANAEKLYLYVVSRDKDKLMPVELHELNKGFSTIKLELPADRDSYTIMLLTAVDGQIYSKEVKIRKPKAEETEITAESFRNKLIPGSREIWRLRLTHGAKTIADGAMIATMYDHALDALQKGFWPAGSFNFYNSSYMLSLHKTESNKQYISGNVLIGRYDRNVVEIIWPNFRFIGEGGVKYDLARPLLIRGAAAKNSMTQKTEDLAVEEVAVESENAEFDGVGGLMISEPEKFPKEEFRESEVLQAFWKPALVTDDKGNVDIVFTVPNANTTWQFKAFGWSKSLQAASFEDEAVANKPVMVQPNLPRFLRQGDSATVLATVYNNSDAEQTVSTTVEIFDIATGDIIATRTFNDTIAVSASAVVAMPVEAPTTAAAIGYRVRAVAGRFADGEQAAIPVLASSATIIESSTFYVNPDQSEPVAILMKTGNDASVTLQYIQNPVWTVVKAMRGIASNESQTSTGIVSHLFSALAARHITATNPDIAKAIAQWRDNPSEEALKSMLEKNEELKKLMLDQTPWVQAARSNTARMAALADLLDSDRSAQTVTALSESLAKLQNADGGFRWGSWSESSSEWSTEIVLTTLGLARSLDLAGNDLDAMLQRAYTYLEGEVTAERRADVNESFALVSTLFPDFKRSIKGSALIRNTVGHVARSWKADGTVGKAYDVLILAGNGRRTEAANVLASIRQFGVEKPDMGLCFPNVTDMRGYATIIQAYAAMGAPKTEIDRMRQWIIVQAQALDDIGTCNPDYIIAAVLLTGSDWTSVPVSQSVTVNGKPLEIAAQESATGYFSQAIQPAGGRVTVTVKPNGVTPSYGSIIAIGTQVAKEVKAKAGRGLSIEKRFLVERDGAWIETRSFTLGERVRVQLTVKADRDLEYVSIDDERGATLAPVDQLPGFVWNGALAFYRENLDASTRLFIGYLPKGTYHIAYDMTAAITGSFTSGVATLQSQYAPELTAHSAGTTLTVE